MPEAVADACRPGRADSVPFGWQAEDRTAMGVEMGCGSGQVLCGVLELREGRQRRESDPGGALEVWLVGQSCFFEGLAMGRGPEGRRIADFLSSPMCPRCVALVPDVGCQCEL